MDQRSSRGSILTRLNRRALIAFGECTIKNIEEISVSSHEDRCRRYFGTPLSRVSGTTERTRNQSERIARATAILRPLLPSIAFWHRVPRAQKLVVRLRDSVTSCTHIELPLLERDASESSRRRNVSTMNDDAQDRHHLSRDSSCSSSILPCRSETNSLLLLSRAFSRV